MNINSTRKRVSEKPIAAFSIHTRHLCNYMTKPVWSLECLDLEERSYSQLQGSLSQDYKYMHAKQIPHQLSFPSHTIPD